ncbi:hypothetical protein Pryu01_01323 [Paraliobacillus ryukyuensis]|uniref:Uncharacterized protein n=1 Tax=Paraliobacillus ryukyuensis TaxID=200904 RepID=A0A366EBM0_9BACI|nr:hypothetical protein [Paraliobacillus ryukyuensis]RBO99445.1 hypothetical protein DES48_104118 [Paraliobacillus ryukyuensis]
MKLVYTILKGYVSISLADTIGNGTYNSADENENSNEETNFQEALAGNAFISYLQVDINN